MRLAKPIPELSEDTKHYLHSKIKFSDECWEWTGNVEKGYGFIWIEGSNYRVHRVAYEFFKKEKIPLDLAIDHLCYNKRCVNPSHLEVVTYKENARRSFKSGRGQAVKNKLKTHCLHGHPHNKENTYIRPDGGRDCRVCKRLWLREHQIPYQERKRRRLLRKSSPQVGMEED